MYFGIISTVTYSAGIYLALWDIPLVSYGSIDVTLLDKSIYSTLVRVGVGFNKLGKAFGEVRSVNKDQ